MTITIEISKPFQIMPGFYRSPFTLRVWWLWFAVSFHPMREDELATLLASGVAKWEER